MNLKKGIRLRFAFDPDDFTESSAIGTSTRILNCLNQNPFMTRRQLWKQLGNVPGYKICMAIEDLQFRNILENYSDEGSAAAADDVVGFKGQTQKENSHERS